MTKPGQRTVADLIALGEDVRAELINGEIVYKDAAPVIEHGMPQLCVGGWLMRRFQRLGGGRWPSRSMLSS